jgi:hypothetical protein
LETPYFYDAGLLYFFKDITFQQRVETSNGINVKTNNDNVNDNVNNNGAAGGGAAAQRTKTTTRQNQHVFVLSRHISPTQPTWCQHRNF